MAKYLFLAKDVCISLFYLLIYLVLINFNLYIQDLWGTRNMKLVHLGKEMRRFYGIG